MSETLRSWIHRVISELTTSRLRNLDVSCLSGYQPQWTKESNQCCLYSEWARSTSYPPGVTAESSPICTGNPSQRSVTHTRNVRLYSKRKHALTQEKSCLQYTQERSCLQCSPLVLCMHYTCPIVIRPLLPMLWFPWRSSEISAVNAYPIGLG